MANTCQQIFQNQAFKKEALETYIFMNIYEIIEIGS